MSEILHTTEQDLAALGIIATYIWKPNRLFVRNPNPALGGSYIAADIVSDGTSEEVSASVINEGRSQIASIDSYATEQKTAISAYERDYAMIRSNLAASYQRMYNYFMSQGLIALATIMATAIVNLNYS